jgi:hypothetical protein
VNGLKRALFRSIPPGDLDAASAVNISRDFRQAYDRLSKRLARR